ncbi:hypothetical protein [Burkholderia vietnamiensis]|uniref:hypothetical protein n=1 Tax=Burkholderia vietnamiensis TaxID=60552 RepID=UPI0012D8D760|nr:hypothetical protein [Burkholderia vietnamiensis]
MHENPKDLDLHDVITRSDPRYRKMIAAAVDRNPANSGIGGKAALEIAFDQAEPDRKAELSLAVAYEEYRRYSEYRQLGCMKYSSWLCATVAAEREPGYWKSMMR